LKYAFWDHSLKRWFVMKVAEAASMTSLVLDSQQRPHISWANFGTTHSRLWHSFWDGVSSWKNLAIPLAAENVGYYTSIALDPMDNPSISFYEYDGPKGTEYRVRMRVVMWNGQNWEVSTVDGDNQSGKFNSMAADSKGRLHLAYANVNSGTQSIRYSLWDGNTWHRELVDGREVNNTGYICHAVCIVLDQQEVPHVSYMNVSDRLVKYAVRRAGRWLVQSVDRVAGVAYPDRNSIAIDEDGTPFVGYYDSGTGVVKVAHLEGNNWVTEVIDRAQCGYTSSLQIDRGTVWISYTDEGNGGVKVARASLSEVRGSAKSRLAAREKDVARKH
jgi:hypothetical protein